MTQVVLNFSTQTPYVALDIRDMADQNITVNLYSSVSER